ncbi:ABC transporter permease [Georgenia thermotolerans]|uniref:ABC transporter permease n=1 Tax=Georgenia thermotolerans TaxID=527326 RepID=A0A7J5UUG7_9MICO|nr:ABC transporter permease [Georgenia thermotolerans]KAE8765939.1 ABC transporter permease [Georgenia thermotolerans]
MSATVGAAQQRGATPRAGFKARLPKGVTGLVGFALAVTLVCALAAPRFTSVANVQSMAFQVAEIGLLSLVIAVSMYTAGIDLSLVSVANLAALVTAQLFVLTDAATADAGTAVLLTVLCAAAGLAVGAGCGAINGLIITKLRVSPILATLGTMQLFNGIAIGWTSGESVYGMPDAFLALGTQYLIGIPVPFVVFAIAATLIAVLMAKRPLGFRIYVLGSNPEASRFAGVPNTRVLFATYVLCGVISAIAGLVIAARSASASPDYGGSYLLLAIVIAVLGGTNPNGGSGTVLGVVIAAVTLQMVSSTFNLLGLSQFTYQVVQGVILIAVMGIGLLSKSWNLGKVVARLAGIAESRAGAGDAESKRGESATEVKESAND